MKKKVLAILMIIIMSVVVLSACGSDMVNPGAGTNEPGAEDINNPSEDQNEQEEVEEQREQFVLENEAFRIYEPVLHAEVEGHIVVRGLARVFEATIQYEFEDGHFILNKGFTTATEGAPGWGEFEIVIEIDELTTGSATVILYEESAKDGSRLHELQIPVKIKNRFVLENEAFKIYEPAPHAEVKDSIVVRGLARVFEGTIQYEFEDGHFILDKGFVTATEGGPGWGEFEIIIELDEVTNYSGTVILYEESAKDGSRMHELPIPVSITD